MIPINISNISKKDRIIVIYDKISNDKLQCYTEEKGLYKIKNSTFNRHRQSQHESSYLFIKFDKIRYKYIEKQYEFYFNAATELKEKTEGKINIFRSGDFPTTALKLFYELTTLKEFPDDIDEFEGLLLNLTKTAALISKTKYTGPGYKYDIISMYPSILTSPQFSIPTGPPQEIQLTKREFMDHKNSYFRYGIYACLIDVKNKMLFRENKNNLYTHIDLNRAKELGYNIEIIEGQDNFFCYSKSLTNGHKVFGNFVKTVYDLKKQNVTGAKNLINCLWGKLCESRKCKFRGSEFDAKLNTAAGDITINFFDDDDKGEVDVKVEIETNNFYTSFARLKPFLLARGRYIASKLIEKYVDKVVMVHTDGFILTEKVEFTTGSKMGDLKYEGHDPNCIITKLSKYKFTSCLDE